MPAIVKKIVDLHRGTIEVESEPGKGTAVKVTLPGQMPRPAGAEKAERTERKGRIKPV